jgi:ketol-acid reductoisomerase
VAPRLGAGAAVCFASGYALAYGLVEAPALADVLLLAPRMLGDDVRVCYLDGTGFLSYVSVEQDASGQAEDRLLALALAAGSLRRGAMRLSARQEATLDLLVEQGVGPYIGAAFQIAFALGTKADLPPEALVCELYMSGEMERVIRTMARVGFLESVRSHGLVAAYGGLWSMETIDVEAMERHFHAVLEQIGSGAFARRLQAEEAQGYPTRAVLDTLLDGDDPITAAERRVRGALG